MLNQVHSAMVENDILCKANNATIVHMALISKALLKSDPRLSMMTNQNKSQTKVLEIHIIIWPNSDTVNINIVQWPKIHSTEYISLPENTLVSS